MSKSLYLIALAFTAPLLCTQSLADTNIERSCIAKYRAYIPGFIGSDGFVRFRVDGYAAIDAKYDFEARRGCGATVPNRCRERARDAAFACMSEHAKTQGAIPEACKSNGVRGYTLSDMKAAFKPAACREAKGYLSAERYQMAREFPLKVTLQSVVSGDRGCGKNDEMSEVRSVGQLEVKCD